MDSTFTDDNVTQTLMDLERSYAEMDQVAESLERSLDTYSILNTAIKSYSGEAESFEGYIRPLLDSCYMGTSYSIESYSPEAALETLKKMGKAILEAIRRMFKLLIDTLADLDIAATWMVQQANSLERKRVTSVGKSPSKPQITMGRNHRYLRVGRIFSEDSVKIFSDLKNLNDVITVVNTDYTPTLSKASAKLSQIGNQLHDDKLDRALTDIVEDMGLAKIAGRLKMTSVDHARFGRDKVLGSTPLLGGMSLYLLQGNLVEKGVKALRFHGFVFTTTSKDPYRLAETHDFKTMSPADIVGLPEILKKILGQVSKGSDDQVRRKMAAVRNDMDRFVSNKMASAEVTEADIEIIRSATNAISYWSRSVVPPLYGNTMSVCRTVLSYAQASAKTWQ